ncbi:predicted protein [Plenodomus lingam JN3]|uniref:Predicted protein n=1 Tax=Leptosphaeria maculans (strain JN3 / isolate v23.1.3 / race Av1-4-5-6-7-8) TaxID=985895 RepID=E5ACY4_LEPMJ|nr:predicted protein [Plenodomus lingam JN3]CBY02336.1 predicted protein [Plenodomus lingam JN3]
MSSIKAKRTRSYGPPREECMNTTKNCWHASHQYDDLPQKRDEISEKT